MNKSIILGGAIVAVAAAARMVKQIARSRRNKDDAKWQEAIEAYKIVRERNAPEVEVQKARQRVGELFQERQTQEAQ